jgi:hypothetical protein
MRRPGGSRKSSPPSRFILRQLDDIKAVGTEEEIKKKIFQVVARIRYVGDVKQIAERYGLHHLKSKRMRTSELRRWIVDNHPAIRALRGETFIGVDWGVGNERTVVVIAEVKEDGTIKITGPNRPRG